MKAREIAAIVEGKVVGDGEKEVSGVASLAAAGPSHLSFVEDEKFVGAAVASNAGVLIVGEFNVSALGSRTLVITKNPRLAFAKAGAVIARQSRKSTGVHASAVMDSSANLGTDVSVGAQAYIGPRVKIGQGTVIGPGCMLLGDIEIGEDC